MELNGITGGCGRWSVTRISPEREREKEVRKRIRIIFTMEVAYNATNS